MVEQTRRLAVVFGVPPSRGLEKKRPLVSTTTTHHMIYQKFLTRKIPNVVAIEEYC
jgi:hypothetical protein